MALPQRWSRFWRRMCARGWGVRVSELASNFGILERFCYCPPVRIVLGWLFGECCCDLQVKMKMVPIGSSEHAATTLLAETAGTEERAGAC